MCYPYIINICTAHIIAASTQVSKKFLDDDDDDDSSLDPCYQSGPELDEAFIASQPSKCQAWLRSLRCDPIKLVVDFVHHICASDSRKQEFAGLVQHCTKDDPKLCDAPPLQLMLQCFCVL
jgi:hypothetical protein